MIWVAALIASSAATLAMPAGPVAATVEARASVRILSAAKISFEPESNAGLPPVREGIVHDQGTTRIAKLIEFQ